MKITVIGAGAIGSAVAYELNKNDGLTQLQVCDTRARSLQEVHERVKSTKLRSFQTDARDPNVLESIVKGSACVISCVPPKINPVLADLCLSLGCHFCDLGGNEDIVHQELQLDSRARAKSVWIVPNCGLAPGLVNILCLRGLEQFDEVEAAHLRVGDVPLHPEPPFNFRISWSAEKIIDDYTDPVHLIADGQLQECAPLSHDEHIHFAAPFGTMEAFCTAGSLSTLIEDLDGKVKTLDHKTIRWPGHANQMRFLLGLGFGEKRNIDVRTHLTYRDVLIRRLRQRLGGAFEDAVLLRVLIKGTQGGKKRTLLYEMIDRFDEAQGLTAMERCTSIPTAVVASMIASHRVPGGGAAPPERILPREEYCDLLAKRGLQISTKWFDGHVDVTQPTRKAKAES